MMSILLKPLYGYTISVRPRSGGGRRVIVTMPRHEGPPACWIGELANGERLADVLRRAAPSLGMTAHV